MGAHRSAAMVHALELIKIYGASASEAARQCGLTVKAVMNDPEYRAYRGLPPKETFYQRKKKEKEQEPPE